MRGRESARERTAPRAPKSSSTRLSAPEAELASLQQRTGHANSSQSTTWRATYSLTCATDGHGRHAGLPQRRSGRARSTRSCPPDSIMPVDVLDLSFILGGESGDIFHTRMIAGA